MLRNVLIVLLAQIPLVAVPIVGSAPWRWTLAAAWALLQTLLLSQLLGPRGGLFAPVVWRTPPQPRVGLTFDDGPHPDDTPAILDILKSARATATFFFVGDRARRHPDLVRRAVEEGHEVAVHTDTHPWWFSLAPRGRVRREIGDAARTLERLGGRRPVHFRPPVGHKSLFLGEELARQGLTLVTWSSRCFDSMGRSPDAIRRRILSTAGPGGIVLLHEGARRARGAGSSTVAALPGLIAGLRARGLEPVSLEDLRAARQDTGAHRDPPAGAAPGAQSA